MGFRVGCTVTNILERKYGRIRYQIFQLIAMDLYKTKMRESKNPKNMFLGRSAHLQQTATDLASHLAVVECTLYSDFFPMVSQNSLIYFLFSVKNNSPE